MKHIRLALSLLIALSILPSCKPASDSATEESRRLLEQAQMDHARQAAELQQRSDDLQKQLADLQKAVQEKETAELKARLESIRQENELLAADAQAAHQKSLSLAEEIERSRLPKALPYAPPQAPAVPRQPWMSPEDDYSLFYDSLRPHGRWLEVDGYGYAFRPGLADRPSWRPYVDGRWAWTDQGWAWDSNEPFGWACYHYGRWVQVSRHGWLWVPGREWAPAWVSWRYGDDCVGWAPLPPGAGQAGVGHDCDVQYGLGPSSYTFINATHFSRTSYVNVSLSITSITRIFKNTLNVTSIVPSSRGSIFTQRGGPALDWVERRCGSPVMRAPVSFKDRLDRAPDHRRDREHGRPGFHAAPLEIVRGKSKPGIPPIAERIQKPVMLDSWKDVPENRRADLREAMLRQAQLPQPRPALADTPRPAEPSLPRQPEISSPDTPVAGISGQTRPQQPGGGLPQGDDHHGPSAGPGRRPGFPGGENGGQARHEPGMNRKDAPQPGSIVEQDRPQQSGSKPGVEQQPPLTPKTDHKAAEAAAMKAREEEAARLQQELARRQTAMQAQQARAAEQEMQNQGRREMQSRMERQRQEMEKSRQEKLTEESRTREMQFRRHQEEMAAKLAEAEARKRQQEAAMAAQQQAAAQLEQRQAEAMKAREEASRREAEMQERRGREAREAAMKAQQEAAERQREAMERAQQEAAMRAAQEAAERQREAAERAQREAMERTQQEAAMRAAQEAAERQREAAERAQREAIERAQQEAAMRAAQEAAERQREAAEHAQREAMERAQQEAAMRAAQEAAERQREAMERAQREAAERQREMQRQQEEARRQAEETARRQAEEAARRAAEEAARQQGQ